MILIFSVSNKRKKNCQGNKETVPTRKLIKEKGEETTELTK